MSDTSGSGGFGPATRKIRKQIQIVFGPAAAKVKYGGSATAKQTTKGQAATGGSGAGGSGAGGGGGPILSTAVWQPLADDDILEKVVLPPELLYYVKAMSRFIHGAKRGALPAVVEEFELREESKFPSLRRYISSHAPGNSEGNADGSEQHSRAGGAFNAGSARWGQELSGIADPTQITIRQLVDLIRSRNRYEQALLLSPRRILQEYGERLIRGLIREDDPWREKATPALIRDLHAQLGRFFAEHSAATEWEPQQIEETIEDLPALLRD